MRLYSVHLRDHGRRADQDLILVKEGFSWPAFVFTFVWALFTRMWWVAIGLFAIVMLSGYGLVALGVSETVDAIVTVALAVAVGFLGNDLRRWTLTRRGYQEVAMVSGKNAEEATRRFLDDADVTPHGIYP